MLLSRPVRIVASVITLTYLLTGCGGNDSNGSPSPAPTSAASSAADGPTVPAALPTQALLSKPCSVLTAAVAGQVGLASPGKEDTSASKGCTWKSSSTELNQVTLTPLPQNAGGISDIYALKVQDAYFEPVAISGYPGVFADVQDARTQGSCTLWLGVTDKLAVSVIPRIQSGPNKTTPCAIAQKFATALVASLKA